MKIIDLLVKIANNDELPTKIKYKDNVYYLGKNTVDLHTYQTEGSDTTRKLSLIIDNEYLNLKDEVEIIEEEPKPITKESIEALGYACGEIRKCFENGWNKSLENKPLEEEKKIPEKLNKDRYIGTDLSVEDDMLNKINEIIDYLKSKGE